MPTTADSLHLVLPGLLGPLPAASRLQPAPRDKLIEELLARADIAPFPGRDLATTLAALFGLDYGSQSDLPAAPLRLTGQGGGDAEGYWIQADPICLRPDRDRLLLFDTRDMAIKMDEAEQLACAICDHFSDLHWQLRQPTPHDWYLRLTLPPNIETSSLGDAFGRSIDRFMPRGAEALRWHGLMNEIQMLFHQAPVNQLREQRGLQPISGVWFHGGGSLPSRLAARFDKVWADDPLAKGLATVANIPCESAQPRVTALVDRQHAQLIVDDRLQRPVWRADPYDWSDGLAELSVWISELVAAVRRQQVGRLYLYPCTGRVYNIDRRALWRFWRRQYALCDRLQQHDPSI